MKRLFTFSHCKLALSAVMLLAYTAAKATFVVVPIPTTGPNGYNADVIANGAPPSGPAPVPNWAQQTTTHAFDAGTYNLVENGYKPTATSPNVLPSLPVNGIINATNVANLFWQLAPSSGPGGVGNSNNSIRLTGATTFTIDFPTGANALIGDVYILGASTGGATSTTITMTFTDNSTQVFTGQNFLDWIGGNPYEYLGAGRVIRATGQGDPGMSLGDNPRFYAVKLTLPFTQYHKDIKSVTIQKITAGTVLNIMAVTVDHQACRPVQVTPVVVTGTLGLTSAMVRVTAPSGPPGPPPYVPPASYDWVVTMAPQTTAPATGFQTIASAGANTDIQVTGLEDGKQYYFHVRTNCGSGITSLWRTISFTTINCTPPTGVSIPPASINMTQATPQWTAGAQVQSPAVTAPLLNATSGSEWLVDLTAGDPAGLGNFISAPFAPPAVPSLTQVPQSGLTPGTTYFLHVRKQCTSGTQGIAYSNWVNVQFPTLACPTTSLSPQVTNITTVSARLKWRQPAVSSNPNAGYEIAVTTSSTPPASGTFYAPIAGPPTPGTQVYDTLWGGLIPGTAYWFHLRNVCAGGYYSAWVSTPFPQTQPCPGAGVPVYTKLTPDTVIVKWPGTTIPGLYEYQYALTLSSQTAAPTTWTPTNNDSIILTQFSQPTPICPGVSYKLWVRSNCTSTNAPWQFVTFSIPWPPCLLPTGHGISNVNMHGATINWTKGFNGIGYQYFVSTSPNPPVNGTYTTDTFYLPTNLIPGTKYYFHLRTHCNTTCVGPVSHNYSGWMKDSFTTSPTCLAPVQPSVTNITAYSAELSWNYYSGSHYEYFMDTVAGVKPASFSGLPINYNAYNPLNLSSGTQYYFHLRTICDQDSSSAWTITPFMTDAVCNTNLPPANLVGTTPTWAKFDWAPVSGAIAYEYEITNSATPPPSGSFITTTEYSQGNLNPGSLYFFHMRAMCSPADRSNWSTKQFITNPLSVGSMSGNDKFNLEVYPNPVTDLMTVTVSGRRGSSARMQLVDMSGKIVESLSVNEDKVEINTSKLAVGMYLLKYVDSENSGVIRIEKQ